MVFIVIWLGFAILCAVIAANKNRSAVGWFFLGLIFGIFAFILILVLGDPKRVQTIIINNQVAAAVTAPLPASPSGERVEPMAPAPLLIEGVNRQPRIDALAAARKREAAVIALRTLAEAADSADEGAVDALLGYLEAEAGDVEFTRREADQLVQWIKGLPRDEAAIRGAVDRVRTAVGDRAAFIAAVDRLEGLDPNERQLKWANFLRRRADA